MNVTQLREHYERRAAAALQRGNPHMAAMYNAKRKICEHKAAIHALQDEADASMRAHCKLTGRDVT